MNERKLSEQSTQAQLTAMQQHTLQQIEREISIPDISGKQLNRLFTTFALLTLAKKGTE